MHEKAQGIRQVNFCDDRRIAGDSVLRQGLVNFCDWFRIYIHGKRCHKSIATFQITFHLFLVLRLSCNIRDANRDSILLTFRVN